jgi:hypothetical protein
MMPPNKSNIALPLLISGIFLVISIVLQHFLGLFGGLLIHLVGSEEFEQFFGLYMTIPLLLGLIGFFLAKKPRFIVLACIQTILSSMMMVIFVSIEWELPYYFYPDRAMIGCVLACLALLLVANLKNAIYFRKEMID